MNSIAASDTVSVDGLFQSPTAVGELLNADGGKDRAAGISVPRPGAPVRAAIRARGRDGRAERRFGCGETVCGKEWGRAAGWLRRRCKG